VSYFSIFNRFLYFPIFPNDSLFSYPSLGRLDCYYPYFSYIPITSYIFQYFPIDSIFLSFSWSDWKLLLSYFSYIPITSFIF
jgi:hypothetical protein